MRITYIGDDSGTLSPKTEVAGFQFRLNIPVQIPPEKEHLFAKLLTNRYFFVDYGDGPVDLPEPPPAIDPVAFAAGAAVGAVPTPEVFRARRVAAPPAQARRAEPAAEADAAAPARAPVPPRRPAAGLPGGIPMPPSQVKG